MSGHRSRRERDSGRGGSTNTPAIQPRYEDFQQMQLEPLVAEDSWHNDEENDFPTRIVANHYRIADGSDRVPRTWQDPGSVTSSMAMSDQSRGTGPGSARGSSRYTTNPLERSQSSTGSGSIPRTSNASTYPQSIIIEEHHGLSDSPEPSNGGLACAYAFLACSFDSFDFHAWDAHCRSHFQGRLPTSVRCPFDCSWYVSAATGEETWNYRNEHIMRHHLPGGTIDHSRRADTTLIDHLWREGLIDESQEVELRRYGRVVGLRRPSANGYAQRQYQGSGHR